MSGSKDMSVYYKEKGNEAYLNNQYDDAIEYYSKAIEINNTNPTIFLNRAKCYKHKKMFDKQYQDSNEAIELDDKYIKAYLLNGEALVEQGKKEHESSKIDKGIQRMQKALNMCSRLNQKQFENDIKQQIKKAQKIKWYKQQEIEQVDRSQLISNLRNKLEGVQDKEFMQRFENFLTQTGEQKSTTTPAPSNEPQTPPLKKTHSIKEIPEFLLCRITDELMEEPVIIESGFTYEKNAILRHFEKNGNFDPVTRQKVDPKLVINNRYIKQATEYFLEKQAFVRKSN